MNASELIRKVRRIQIHTSRVTSEALAGTYHSAFRGRGVEFEEVRPYVVGDDVRTIDWNVSARAGAPHVKQFREERELCVMLAVDLSGSLDFGTRSQFKREMVAEMASALPQIGGAQFWRHDVGGSLVASNVTQASGQAWGFAQSIEAAGLRQIVPAV